MLRFLTKLEGYVAIAALLVMLGCIVVQVFFRYCLADALEWPEEIARYAFICAVFLGASLAAGEGRHLEISVAKNLFGARAAYAVHIVSAAFMALFCLVMLVWGIRMVAFVRESEQIAASINMPMYLMYMIIPLSMAFMIIRTLGHALRTLRRLREKGKSRDETLTDMSGSW